MRPPERISVRSTLRSTPPGCLSSVGAWRGAWGGAPKAQKGPPIRRRSERNRKSPVPDPKKMWLLAQEGDRMGPALSINYAKITQYDTHTHTQRHTQAHVYLYIHPYIYISLSLSLSQHFSYKNRREKGSCLARESGQQTTVSSSAKGAGISSNSKPPTKAITGCLGRGGGGVSGSGFRPARHE